MKITNELNLPAPFVSMAQSDYQFEPNEYRVTSLLKGAREAILERRHGDEIERDVSDMIWLLFGTAVHSILERHEEGADEFKEQRLKVPVGDYILSGQFDLYNGTTGTVTDYKTCSVWKVIKGEYADWRQQTLIYCWMLRRIGFDANQAEIVAIMKDHSKTDAKRKPDYPKLPVRKIHFTFADEDFLQCTAWLDAQFDAISRYETLPDDDLPVCSMEERYNTGDKYAVMKKGRKTALRVLDSQEEADAWMQDNGGDTIEFRPGQDKKCSDYCAVSAYCSYYREHVKEEEDA